MSTTLEKEHSKFGETKRKDLWWLEPLLYVIGLGGFVIYATWAAFQGNHFEYGPYLSPFYSPKLEFDWWKMSPAFLILWIPAGFRTTCYYYRKAYYRSFFMDPPACAVSEGCKKYTGETSFPLIFQNIHRYFFYLAAIFIFFLWVDAFQAFNFDGKFGVGVGSLVLTANVVLLSCYTFSCHSFRHLIGGFKDSFKCGYQHAIYEKVSCANENHMLWAWLSLFSVGFADIYVRLCSMGIWTDFRLL